eukprot:TRINITY_DN3489_c0_g1_i10.p1 TRINITY_DN3489_c0_g1~~TRINITY_DN3489_c0_g1_i10.p1  ORF type:complete len:154 (+),score=8.51 TRINITY_DN3489_c0_g1_i10:64-525(+)
MCIRDRDDTDNTSPSELISGNSEAQQNKKKIYRETRSLNGYGLRETMYYRCLGRYSCVWKSKLITSYKPCALKSIARENNYGRIDHVSPPETPALSKCICRYLFSSLNEPDPLSDAVILRPNVRVSTLFPTTCLLYTSPSPRDGLLSRMPSSA